MGHVYPEIVENRELMRRVILSEEERFGATLRQGRAFLDEALAALDGEVLPGEQAFTLHDTYGFPVEVTRELCGERGIEVDMEGFARCMDEQRERARAANTKDAEAPGPPTAACMPSFWRSWVPRRSWATRRWKPRRV